MGALLEIGSDILSRAVRLSEVSAQNISNVTTPGYKRSISFEKLLAPTDLPAAQVKDRSIAIDFTAGKQIDTGNPNDLAISGDGFFAVASGEQRLYTRQGQFERQADGRLTIGAGLALQADGGGDVVLGDGPFEVTADGVVVQDGTPLARLAIMEIADLAAMSQGTGSFFGAPQDAVSRAVTATIRQGALEASNVSTADEMVALMQATRRAEAGQRVISIYDELMGRALNAFGQA